MDTGRQKSPTTTYLEINPHLNGKIYEEIVPWLQRQYDLCAYVFMLWRQGDVVIFIFTLNADTSLSDPIQKTREVCIQVVCLPGEKIVQFPKEKRVTLNNSPKNYLGTIFWTERTQAFNRCLTNPRHRCLQKHFSSLHFGVCNGTMKFLRKLNFEQ